MAETDVEALIRAMGKVVNRRDTEIKRLRKLIADFYDWCQHERSALGAVDGYDYNSGQEYGLRRAEIEIVKRLRTLDSPTCQAYGCQRPATDSGFCGQCGGGSVSEPQEAQDGDTA